MVRTHISVALLFFPSFFFWGVGMSLGSHLGLAGVGYGEIVFAFSSLLVFVLFGSRVSNLVIRELKLVLLLATGFTLSLLIGTLTGAFLWGATYRDIFIFLRQVFYLFFLVPTIAAVAIRVPVERLLDYFMYGVVFSAVYNISGFDFHRFWSLVGQNMLGLQVTMATPYVLYRFWAAVGFLHRMFYGSICALFVVTVFFSLSKGAWISILASFLIFTFLVWKKSNPRKALPLYVLLIALAVAFAYYRQTIVSFAVTEITASEGSNSNKQRIAAMKSGFAIGTEFLFGVGGSHYPEAAALIKDDVGLLWIMPDPHSTYAHVASMSGMVGFVFFLGLFLYPLMKVHFERRLIGEKYLLYIPMLFGIYLMANTTGEPLTQPGFWALAAVVLGDVVKQRAKSPGVMSVPGRMSS